MSVAKVEDRVNVEELDLSALERWGKNPREISKAALTGLRASLDRFGLVQPIFVNRWHMGAHRLICGDSTEDEVLQRLFSGERADMVWTDPPYGVNVTGAGGKAIAGDLTFTLIPLMFAKFDAVLAEGAWAYVCGGSSNFLTYAKLFEHHFRALPNIIVWDKGRCAVLRRNGYHSCFEFIFVGFLKGGGGRWYATRGSDDADDIWREKPPSGKARTHITEKPVAMPLRAIGNSCPEGGIVYDPFCGSGGAVVAAEQLGRRCYAVEISPKYCDVIVRRWEELTGRKARRTSMTNLRRRKRKPTKKAKKLKEQQRKRAQRARK